MIPNHTDPKPSGRSEMAYKLPYSSLATGSNHSGIRPCIMSSTRHMLAHLGTSPRPKTVLTAPVLLSSRPPS